MRSRVGLIEPRPSGGGVRCGGAGGELGVSALFFFTPPPRGADCACARTGKGKGRGGEKRGGGALGGVPPRPPRPARLRNS